MSSSPVWTRGRWWIETAVPLVAGSEDAEECVGEREEQAVAFELDSEEEQEDL